MITSCFIGNLKNKKKKKDSKVWQTIKPEALVTCRSCPNWVSFAHTLTKQLSATLANS
jgi:hypothetical protein